jgi:hypothetical protein
MNISILNFKITSLFSPKSVHNVLAAADIASTRDWSHSNLVYSELGFIDQAVMGSDVIVQAFFLRYIGWPQKG